MVIPSIVVPGSVPVVKSKVVGLEGVSGAATVVKVHDFSSLLFPSSWFT